MENAVGEKAAEHQRLCGRSHRPSRPAATWRRHNSALAPALAAVGLALVGGAERAEHVKVGVTADRGDGQADGRGDGGAARLGGRGIGRDGKGGSVVGRDGNGVVAGKGTWEGGRVSGRGATGWGTKTVTRQHCGSRAAAGCARKTGSGHPAMGSGRLVLRVLPSPVVPGGCDGPGDGHPIDQPCGPVGRVRADQQREAGVLGRGHTNVGQARRRGPGARVRVAGRNVDGVSPGDGHAAIDGLAIVAAGSLMLVGVARLLRPLVCVGEVEVDVPPSGDGHRQSRRGGADPQPVPGVRPGGERLVDQWHAGLQGPE
eukprot:scaffold843_cov108-Isochrysis_galbana.AAC.2